jgi:hypothetical protein
MHVFNPTRLSHSMQSSPTGSSSSLDSALIGSIARGVGSSLLLCCLLLVMAVVIWGACRGRSPYHKLVQLDYEAVAYGDVKEDVVLPKKLQEVLSLPSHRLLYLGCAHHDLSPLPAPMCRSTGSSSICWAHLTTDWPLPYARRPTSATGMWYAESRIPPHTPRAAA